MIHDYNYAQVLTLDLLAKGYRYAEVPISYRFREHGRSFVRLGRTCARRPGVVRLAQSGPSVLDDVVARSVPRALRPTRASRPARRHGAHRPRPQPIASAWCVLSCANRP